MNKAKVNELIPEAYTVLQDVKIAKDDKINKTYQRLLTSFGAAVYGGSLLAAIAFFSEESADKEEKKDKDDKGKKNKNVDSVCRPKLMMAIYRLLTGVTEGDNHKSLFYYIREELKAGNDEFELRNKVLDAAVSLKLAMNLYTLEKQTDSKSAKETEGKTVESEDPIQGEAQNGK